MLSLPGLKTYCADDVSVAKLFRRRFLERQRLFAGLPVLGQTQHDLADALAPPEVGLHPLGRLLSGLPVGVGVAVGDVGCGVCATGAARRGLGVRGGVGPPAACAPTAGRPRTMTAAASAAVAVRRLGDLCLCRVMRGRFLRRLARRWGGEGGSFLAEWCRKMQDDQCGAGCGALRRQVPTWRRRSSKGIGRQYFALFHRNITEQHRWVYSWNGTIFTRSTHHSGVMAARAPHPSR